MKFSIKDFFSKRDQICSFLQIWSNLLKKNLYWKTSFFCVVCGGRSLVLWYFQGIEKGCIVNKWVNSVCLPHSTLPSAINNSSETIYYRGKTVYNQIISMFDFRQFREMFYHQPKQTALNFILNSSNTNVEIILKPVN